MKENNWIPPTTGIISWDVCYSLLSTLSFFSLAAFQNPFKAREIERYGRVEEESLMEVGDLEGEKIRGKIAT
jgi:hypothetical protein